MIKFLMFIIGLSWTIVSTADSGDDARKFDGPTYLPKFLPDDDSTMEIAVFVDEPMYQMYNKNFSSSSAELKLTEYIKTVLNDVQLIFRNPYLTPKITFKVVRYEIFKQQPVELYQADPKGVYAEPYLKSFCTYQYNMPNRDWDHSLLITGYDLAQGRRDYRITGATRMSSVCDPYNSCTLFEGMDLGAPLVGAHEVAHALGVRHDNGRCSDSNSIMLDEVGPGRVGWSSCSVDDLRSFVAELDKKGTNCMRLTKPDAPALDLEGLLLPGIKFNAHEQCSMVLGPGHIMVRWNKTAYADIPCHQSMCMSTQTAVIKTTHPALEGTMCGEAKYCKYGRCVDFPKNPTGYPQQVNGEWTEWKRMPCHQCSCGPILGSIGVMPSSRDCKNPEPSENGRFCAGSAVRGIVCDSQCKSAKYTPKSYVKAVCEARRNEHPDASLSGEGLRLATSSCKIHCASRYESLKILGKYRFFGDNMPDGTPCGEQKYCVSGECLSLSCNNRALIADKERCPTKSELCDLGKQAEWESWGLWSPCSVTCNNGIKSRKRRCYGDGCNKYEDTEFQECQKMSCDAIKDSFQAYEQWSEWSACSATCGRGVTRRTRVCKQPSPICSTLGDDSETKDCTLGTLCPDPAMEWSSWSVWSSCSVSCGQGSRRRSRFCTKSGCPGQSDEVKPCTKISCIEAYARLF